MHVPAAYYNIMTDWADKKANPFNKDKRHTLATDIEKQAKKEPKPEVHTYSPRHHLVEAKVLGAFNLKGKRADTSFLAEPVYAGCNSPKYHDKKHTQTESRVTSKKFYKPLNAKLDAIPSFLRAKRATSNISPASHHPLNSFKSACLPNKTFYVRKGSPKNFCELESIRTKGNPGVGHYNYKNIEAAYDKITLGASKGWK